MNNTRQRVLILSLLLFLLVPVFSLSESSYAPKLGMTMEEYILKYNAVPAPLGAPYKSLDQPAFWTNYEEYQVAWFYPEGASKVALLLMSTDTAYEKSTKLGLDIVQVFAMSPEGWIPLLSITNRCTGIFVEDPLGLSTASILILDIVNYYYENTGENTDYIAYRALDVDETLALTFGYADGYYFMITSMDDVR